MRSVEGWNSAGAEGTDCAKALETRHVGGAGRCPGVWNGRDDLEGDLVRGSGPRALARDLAGELE